MSVCHSILPVSHSISDKSCLLVMQLYRTVRYSIVTSCRQLSISITADWKSDRCARCIGSTKRITSNGVRVRVGIGVENQKRRAYDLVKTAFRFLLRLRRLRSAFDLVKIRLSVSEAEAEELNQSRSVGTYIVISQCTQRWKYHTFRNWKEWEGCPTVGSVSL